MVYHISTIITIYIERSLPGGPTYNLTSIVGNSSNIDIVDTLYTGLDNLDINLMKLNDVTLLVVCMYYATDVPRLLNELFNTLYVSRYICMISLPNLIILKMAN